MDEDTSFDYDEFSLDFNDPDLDSQLDSFTSTAIPKIIPKKIQPTGGLKPPPPKQQQQQQQQTSKQLPQIQSRRNVLPITRHSQAILRPALPPTKRTSNPPIVPHTNVATTSTTNNYMNRKLNNPIVHPNPFQHKVIPIPKRQEILDDSMDVSYIEEETREEDISQRQEEEEEEEMPIINVSGTGGFIRTDLPPSSTTSTSHNLAAKKVVMGKPSTSTAMMLPPPVPRVVVGMRNGSISKGKGVEKIQDSIPTVDRGARESSAPASVVGKGLDSAERRELNELRAHKVMLEKDLESSKTIVTKKEQELMSRTGEVTIVRKNLQRTEAMLQNQTEASQKIKRGLEEKLEEKEKEFRREMEKMKVQAAFKRQELETSARRPSTSQWSSTGRPRSASLAPNQTQQNSMGPPALPSIYGNSPSLGRTKAPPGITGSSIKKPIFPGFVNAFETSSSQSSSKLLQAGGESFGASTTVGRGRRSESMGPPPPTLNYNHQQKKKIVTTPIKSKGILKNLGSGSGSGSGSKDKGKGKMLIDMTLEEEEEEEEERRAGGAEDSMMVDQENFGDESRLGAEVIDDDDIEMDDLSRGDYRFDNDWRGEILSALFTHTTFIHYDSESVTTVPPSLSSLTQRSTSTNSATARSTAYYSTSRTPHTASTSTYNAQGIAIPTPVTQIDTSPIPTFHYLTNFRFPLGTPSSIVADYEDACRDFFTFLGRRLSSSRATLEHTFETREEEEYFEMMIFLRELGSGLETMLRLLEGAGTIGPIIPLLSLISTLILLFPEFSLYFLNDPTTSNTTTTSTTNSNTSSINSTSESKFLPLLARIIRRFGKPTVPNRLVENPNIQSSSLSGRGKARERSRKQRGVLEKKSEGGKKDDERIEVEPIKRDGLIKGTLEVLEGLAWRIPDGTEEIFVGFLAAPEAIATLLDVNQSNNILRSTIGVLTLLSTRPNLFRALIGIPFTEGPDIRLNNTDCALFNRIGTLTGRKRVSFIQSYELDMSLITFVTSLLSKHDDSILLLTGSVSLLPELLQKLYQDVRVLWEYDGQDVTESSLINLKLIAKRLSALVHFFYYLIAAPTSTFSIAEFLSTNKSSLGLPDRYNVAFGTLSYANLPDWAEDIVEGVTLTTLSYLAQEIMEDVSPREAEEIESCFTTISGGEEGGDMMSGDEEERAFRQGLSQS